MPSLGAIVKFHVLVGLCAISIYYWKPGLINKTKEFVLSQLKSPQTSPPSTWTASDLKLFTTDELAKYDGNVNEEEIYVSILGSVYDVTPGKNFYGRGCGYAFFTGKDASVSFVTGEFEKFTPDSDDVAALKPADILGILQFKEFYDTKYVLKGKLIGRFYDENGEPTEYFRKVEALAKVGEYEKEQKNRKLEEFPPCNIEWTAETGTRVWCTAESGGIRRNWIGVPRKYFEPGQTSFRCACVKPEQLSSPLLKPYEDCKDDAVECFYNLD
ncbi:unnamed protein product [Hermetia illucens]|uniref:Cytochrome b5 heme-binding domain-containing protein n=1 Tax=Hermetia illucens TaxID=343691 RepID=A0A7R8Z2J3_HERIL|nr:neuferricin homolog [Hermetia illucens]CAD7090917.1 unnamed protein product [Hermetia illucens]